MLFTFTSHCIKNKVPTVASRLAVSLNDTFLPIFLRPNKTYIHLSSPPPTLPASSQLRALPSFFFMFNYPLSPISVAHSYTGVRPFTTKIDTALVATTPKKNASSPPDGSQLVSSSSVRGLVSLSPDHTWILTGLKSCAGD